MLLLTFVILIRHFFFYIVRVPCNNQSQNHGDFQNRHLFFSFLGLWVNLDSLGCATEFRSTCFFIWRPGLLGAGCSGDRWQKDSRVIRSMHVMSLKVFT